VVHYSPSVYEYLVVVASASLVSMLYIVFERSGVFEARNIKEDH